MDNTVTRPLSAHVPTSRDIASGPGHLLSQSALWLSADVQRYLTAAYKLNVLAHLVKSAPTTDMSLS